MSVSNGPNQGLMINALTGDNFDVSFRRFLRAIDTRLIAVVKDHTLATPPGSPANGDRYVVAASPTGAWAGHATQIATWTMDDPANPAGVWEFHTPANGWDVFSIVAGVPLIFNSTSWILKSYGSLPSYTVANLPASPSTGAIAYATNGRKVGEGAGTGTGVPCYYSNSAWRRYSDDTVVAA
jgi:hypothetical protein